MEDERGFGGHNESSSVSEPPLSGKFADESVAEVMGSDNQVEEVFEEGDGEEIMVAVVGSDVYVDGVSGNGEGDDEIAEAGNLEGDVVDKNEECSDVLSEGEGNKMDVGGAGLLELRDDKRGVTKEVDTSLSISVGVKAEKVSELPVGDVEGVDDEKVSASVPPVEVGGVSSDEKKTKVEAVDKDISESSGQHMEAVSDEKADLADEKETLQLSDNSRSHDRVVVDSVSDGEIEEAHDANGGIIGKVDSVNASGGELSNSATQKAGSFMAEDECPNTNSDSGEQGKSVLEKDVSAAERKDTVPKPDAPTDVMDDRQSCSDNLHGAKLEPNDQTDGASPAGAESIHEISCDTKKEETKGNDECSKIKDDVEANEFQNEVITRTGDAVEVNKDNHMNVDIKYDAEENVQNTMSTSGSTGEKIVQPDSGACSDQPIISTMVGAETGELNVVIPLVKDVDGGEYGEKGMDIDSEEGARSVIETADVMETKDHVPCPHSNSEGFANIVGECGSPQSTKAVVALQVTEASSHEADKLEKTKIIPNGDSAVAADSDTAQVSMVSEGNSNTELLLSSTDILLDGGINKEKREEVGKSSGEDKMPRESNGIYVVDALEGPTSEAKPMEVDEDVNGETASEGPSSERSNVETVKYAGSLGMKQLGYLNPRDDEGSFSLSDLVWGKVRSHPWWPGQIFELENASEKAVKHYKKDSYLVAYFGDQTFAWNDSSALKPFRPHFSQIEKQSNSESFHNAVNCALEEVERRVQLGLSCSCIPKEDYTKIGTQVVENTGIREASSQRYGVDQSSCASCFEPSELLEFIRAVAPCASSGADRLDLVIARAQLSAFCSFKGYRSPIESPSSGELLEIDGDTEQISDEAVTSQKARHIPKEDAQSRKERSLMELMNEREYSPDVNDDSVAGDLGKSVSSSIGKKRKALDPLAEGSDKRASVSTPTSQAPKPSFKIGECIRRVANQLTGSTSLVKGSNDDVAVDGSPIVFEPSEKQSVVVSAESLSVSNMLSQLELLAQDPKKRHTAHNQIRAFFLGFRSSTTLPRRGRKKKSERAIGGSGEDFEFDDVNDSYWTDRIVQNYSAEQLLHDRMNGSGSHQLVSFDVEKTGKAGRKPHSGKRFFSGDSPTSAPESDENAKRIKQESSPAELILSFSERNHIPSEISLNKMFRRFGPLMESETEVDHESGSAKVIFKRGFDAEVARNSAEKFSIFGPVLVSYQIGYSPVISVKILPVSLPPSQEEAILML